MRRHVLGLLMLCILLLVGCSTDTLLLKKSEFIVEYGEEINKDPAIYLDTENTDIIKNAKISLEVENEKDKKYPAVGEYTMSISHKKNKKDIKIVVKDTKAPTFVDFPAEIVVEENAVDINWEKYFKVTDLSEYKVEINKDEVNLLKAGTYNLKVVATDKYKNKTEKVTKVNVVTSKEVSDGKALTTNIEGNIPEPATKKVPEVKRNGSSESNNVEKQTPSASSNSGNNTNANTNQNATNGSNTPPSNQGGTPDNGNDNGNVVEPTPPEPPATEPTCRIDYIGNSGKVWYPGQEEEAYNWADQYVLDHINEVWGWSGAHCGPCGLSGPFTIDFKYN